MNLQLDPHSFVIPYSHALLIINLRGRFELKGKNIHSLHERMAPHLNGMYQETELLEKVPPSLQPSVLSYLVRLRQAGALLGRTPEPQASSFQHSDLSCLGHTSPRLTCTVRDWQVDISLDGSEPVDAAVTTDTKLLLRFASPVQAGQWILSRPGPKQSLGHQVLIVTDHEPEQPLSNSELDRRADYARWLLAKEIGLPPRENGLSIYSLSSDPERLTRLAVVERSGAFAPKTLPDQLAMIQPAKVDQVPLVVAVAEHPFFLTRAACFGVTDGAVRDRLTENYLALLKLDEWGDQELTFLAGAVASSLKAYRPLKVACRHLGSFQHAPSLPQLHLRLAEQWAESQLEGQSLSWRSIDLLLDRRDLPLTRFLIGTLRQRISRLPAQVAQSAEGLTVVRANGFQQASLLKDEAPARILLWSIWKEYYGDTAVLGATPALRLTDLVSQDELRLVLRDLKTVAWAHNAQVRVRKIRCWGRTIWIGVLGCAEEE